jgi:hypothetical protein
MGYFDNFDNKLLKKYEKVYFFIKVYRYVLLIIDW